MLLYQQIKNYTFLKQYFLTHPINKTAFDFSAVQLCSIGEDYLKELEKIRKKYSLTKNEKYLKALLSLLPLSFIIKN